MRTARLITNANTGYRLNPSYLSLNSIQIANPSIRRPIHRNCISIAPGINRVNGIDSPSLFSDDTCK